MQAHCPPGPGVGRIAGSDLNRPRIRATPSAALALASASGGFTAVGFAAKVCGLSRHDGCTIRQASCEFGGLRAKGPYCQARPDPPLPRLAGCRRTIVAFFAFRGRVIAAVLVGIRSLRIGRNPRTWIAVGRGHESLRTGVQTLLLHVGIASRPQPHRRRCAGQRTASRLVGRDRQFRGGPDGKIASGLLSGAFCVRRFCAAVVTGG